MKNKKAAPVCAACPAPPLNPAHRKLTEWFGAVRFRHTLLFGVDEAEMWKKLEELYALYEAALLAERVRYDALLRRQEETAHGS